MTLSIDNAANLGPYKLLQRSQANRADQAEFAATRRADRTTLRSPESARPNPVTAKPAIAELRSARAQDAAKPLMERLAGLDATRRSVDAPGNPDLSERLALKRAEIAEARAERGPKPGLRSESSRGLEGSVTGIAGERTFTGEDIDALKAAFGSAAGDDSYAAEYDLNNDGAIDLKDLLSMLSQIDGDEPAQPVSYGRDDLAALLQAFGTSSGQDGFDAASDLNSDGSVDLNDLLSMLGEFDGSQPLNDPTGDTMLDRMMKAFGSSEGEDGYDREADLTGDGSVDLNDLLKHLQGM